MKIVELLKEVLAADGINIRGVYERSDANERKKEGLPKVKGFIGAEFDTNVEIVENAVHYMVDVENGQKTGFFLDRSITDLLCSASAKGKECSTASHTWVHLLSMRELQGQARSQDLIYQSMRLSRPQKMRREIISQTQ